MLLQMAKFHSFYGWVIFYCRNIYHIFIHSSFDRLRLLPYLDCKICCDEHMCVLVAHSCLTLCNPMDYNPPGSSVHGILQARILEWIAIPFSRGSSQARNQTRVYCIAGRLFTFIEVHIYIFFNWCSCFLQKHTQKWTCWNT